MENSLLKNVIHDIIYCYYDDIIFTNSEETA